MGAEAAVMVVAVEVAEMVVETKTTLAAG